MRILLIEPNYTNKYPPLGLMKISTFHKNMGDDVIFYKGTSKELRRLHWDRIYISTLFTFHYKKTIETITFYKNSVDSLKDIYVGGVLATLMQEKIHNETGATIVPGLLNIEGKLKLHNDHTIDCLTPDYSIIDRSTNSFLNYTYPTSNSYISYATRGCIRKCKFCAVPLIEGEFHNSYSLASQVRSIENTFGPKRHLLLLDNNILAANEHFFDIIDEIVLLGFGKGATIPTIINGRMTNVLRYVDFNQGIDARLLVRDPRYIKAISTIAINPLRIAFDDIKDKKVYCKSVRLAAKHGVRIMSNYILFNYNDTPFDFYERLRINIELNEEFKSKGIDSRVWSFPMKYSPVLGEEAFNRKYIGRNWNRKYLRAIQNILLATHGVVGPKRPFFERAFGKTYDEFMNILQLPEDYIISRQKCESKKLPQKLHNKINKLASDEKELLHKIILENSFSNVNSPTYSKNLCEIINIYRPKYFRHTN
jgi:hypothetical protein